MNFSQILILLMMSAVAPLAKAQTDTLEKRQICQNAEFINGKDSLLKFFRTNLKYERKGGCNYPSYIKVKYIIDENGDFSRLTSFRPADANLAIEVTRVLKLMPKWKPSIEDGKAVESEQYLSLHLFN